MNGVYVRPCVSSDLDALEDLAYSSPVGLTSLPEDRARLHQRLANSEQSFSRDVTSPGKEEYLFALVDADDRLLGVSGIVARAGSEEPYFNFRRDFQQTYSQSLAEGRSIDRLILTTENMNKSVFSAFFIGPEYNTALHTELLARARILYMAQEPQRFCEQVIVEFVGVTNAQAESPFWNAVGKAFFAMEYDEAEHLSATRRKHFIGELIPAYPLYVSLLPGEAQAVLGDYDKRFQPMLDVALNEGFTRTACLDIFDAGPCYQIARDQLATLRISRQSRPDKGPVLVTSGDGLSFRCAIKDASELDRLDVVSWVPMGYAS